MKARRLYGYCTVCMCCGETHPVAETCGNNPVPNSTKNKRFMYKPLLESRGDGPLVGALFMVFVLFMILYFCLAFNTLESEGGVTIVNTETGLTWNDEMALHINMVCGDELNEKVTGDQLRFLGIGPDPDGNMNAYFSGNIGPNCEDWRHIPERTQVWRRFLELFGE